MATSEKEAVEEEPQAPDGEESGAAGVTSWLSGWYDTAKQKLAETNEFMRHDIQEFTQAVQSDASKLVAVTATTMKEKLNINVDLEEASAATRVVKDSLSNFLGTIASKVGPIRPDNEDEKNDTVYVGTTAGTRVLSPAEARVFAIRTDPATFCNEPDNENEFNVWLPDFNLDDTKNEISSLMLDCTQIRSLYTKLVPTAVSHRDFWARYFFKIHQHEKAEERRAMLVERAHKTHDDIEWEDDEDEWVQPEVPPLEIQNRKPSQSDTAVLDANKDADDTEIQLERENITPEPLQDNENKTESRPDTNVSEKQSNIPKTEIPCATSPEDVPQDKTATVANNAAVLMTDEIASEEKIPVPKEEPEKELYINEPAQTPKAEEIKSPTETVQNTSEAAADTTVKDGVIKTPSSGESSDDWEKDFDLDMTEDEIQQALQESDKIDVDDIPEDWEDWE